jgi:hypothetical protein
LVFDVDADVVVVVVAYPKRPWDVWCNMKPEDGWKKGEWHKSGYVLTPEIQIYITFLRVLGS